jgi:hypothetical protein
LQYLTVLQQTGDSLDRTYIPKIMAQAAASAIPHGTQEVTIGPIYVDTQHEDLVHDSQLDYYGCKLATASSGEHF